MLESLPDDPNMAESSTRVASAAALKPARKVTGKSTVGSKHSRPDGTKQAPTAAASRQQRAPEVVEISDDSDFEPDAKVLRP